jgi:DNA-binding transcriptional regulator YhcF (GntR family)
MIDVHHLSSQVLKVYGRIACLKDGLKTSYEGFSQMIDVPLPTIKRAIKTLLDLGYLVKIGGNLHIVTQKISDESIKSDTKYQIRSQKVSNLIPKSIKSDTPNIKRNINKNKEDIHTHQESPRLNIPLFSKGEYQSDYVRLSDEEIDRLLVRIQKELGVDNPKPYLVKGVEKIDSYIEMKLTGKAKKEYMQKNHGRVFTTWVIRALKEDLITDLKLEKQKEWNYQNEKRNTKEPI